MVSGRLVVLEGPDGVGKSTLSQHLVEELEELGEPCALFSFPGKEKGTLGRLVYEVHHEPRSHSVSSLTEASKQLLHIAAHIDCIESHITPALREGKWVILDRFWWSTWVYGQLGGVDTQILDAMILVEQQWWADVRPHAVFLVSRRSSISTPDRGRLEMEAVYRKLVERESSKYPVRSIQNDDTPKRTTEEILLALNDLASHD